MSVKSAVKQVTHQEAYREPCGENLQSTRFLVSSCDLVEVPVSRAVQTPAGIGRATHTSTIDEMGIYDDWPTNCSADPHPKVPTVRYPSPSAFLLADWVLWCFKEGLCCRHLLASEDFRQILCELPCFKDQSQSPETTDHPKAGTLISSAAGTIITQCEEGTGAKTSLIWEDLLHWLKGSSILDLRSSKGVEAVCTESYNRDQNAASRCHLDTLCRKRQPSRLALKRNVSYPADHQ